MSRSVLATSAATALLLVALAGCGGGGGGGGSGGGGASSSSSSSSSAAVDNGTLKVMDDSVSITVKNAGNSQFLAIAGQSQLAGAAIATAASAATAGQKWHIIPMIGSQYTIENMLTHQVAGISAASTAAGAGAVQYADNGTNDHLWGFYLLGDGNYLIKNVNSGLYLTADGSGVVTQGPRAASGTAQEWTITSTAATPTLPRAPSPAPASRSTTQYAGRSLGQVLALRHAQYAGQFERRGGVFEYLNRHLRRGFRLVGRQEHDRRRRTHRPVGAERDVRQRQILPVLFDPDLRHPRHGRHQ